MHYRLLTAALLVFSLAECTEKVIGGSDNGQNSQIDGVFNKTFTASCQDGVNATRTALGEGNSVLFQSGDAVSVFDVSLGESPEECSSRNVKFTMAGDPEEDGTATFTGSLENEMASYMAVYPYQQGASLEVGFIQGNPFKYSVYASIPSVQTATPGTFDPAANVSIAQSVKTEDGDILYFKNICALIKFSIADGESYSKIVFRSNAGEFLAGTSLVSTSISASGEFTFSGIMDDGYDSVSLTGDFTGGHWYYIAVNPADLANGFSIDLYDTETHHSTKSHSGNVKLKRSGILNIGELSGDWLGSGTGTDPYRIYSYAQLQLLAKRFSTVSQAENRAGKYYLQMADIDCKGEYIRIGGLDEDNVNSAVDVFFEGNYDGNGKKISNFKLKAQDTIYGAPQYYGLFGQAKNSSFSNIWLEPASIFENPKSERCSTYNAYIGTLIAAAASDSKDGQGIVITNCHVSSSKEFAYTPAAVITVFGGLVGYCCDKFEMAECSNDMDLFFYNDRGEVNGAGLVGVLSAPLTILDYDVISMIDRCRNTGDIRVVDAGGSTQSTAAGLVGMTFDTPSQDLTLRMSNCVNNGNISASTDGGYSYAAGAIAVQDSDGSYDLSGGIDPYLYNCLNTGNINAAGGNGSLASKTGTFAGGICGYVYDDDTEFALCVNTGTITISGDDQTGAISASNGSCQWCYWLNAKSHTEQGASPSLPCTKDGSATNCYYYKSLGQDSLNNRRTGSDGKGGTDIVLDENNTQWVHVQWLNASPWTGSATYGGSGNNLDINLNQ